MELIVTLACADYVYSLYVYIYKVYTGRDIYESDEHPVAKTKLSLHGKCAPPLAWSALRHPILPTKPRPPDTPPPNPGIQNSSPKKG